MARKKRGRWIAVAILLAAIFLVSPALAQTVCGKRSDIVARLEFGYEEFQSSAGIAANGNLVEVFASKKGNWTIIFTKPGGVTCLMAVGEHWQVIKEPFEVPEI